MKITNNHAKKEGVGGGGTIELSELRESSAWGEEKIRLDRGIHLLLLLLLSPSSQFIPSLF